MSKQQEPQHYSQLATTDNSACQKNFHICMFRVYVESPPFHTSTQVLIRIQVLKPTINPGVQVLIGIQLLKTDQTNNQTGSTGACFVPL